MSADRTPGDPVAAYFRCLNTEDWEVMATLWTEDALLRPVGARPRRGPAAIAAFYSHLFDPWEEHLDTPTRTIRAGDVVTVEVTFTGRSRSGTDARFDAVDLFDLRDGRIAGLSTWYDLVAARRAVSS